MIVVTVAKMHFMCHHVIVISKEKMLHRADSLFIDKEQNEKKHPDR
jgi:hypothetical protein